MHSLRTLKSLTVYEMSFSWESMSHSFSDAGLAAVGSLPLLERLVIDFCVGFTSAGLEGLRGATRLEYLSMLMCEQVGLLLRL